MKFEQDVVQLLRLPSRTILYIVAILASKESASKTASQPASLEQRQGERGRPWTLYSYHVRRHITIVDNQELIDRYVT